MAIISTIVGWLTEPIVIISALFWLVAFGLAKLLGKKKDRITIAFPFLVLIRWKVLNKFFRKMAHKYRKFWRIWFNIGAIVSYILMLGAIYFIISNFVQLIIDPKPENAILPLIPGVTTPLPFFLSLLLPILINLTFHEFSHAVAAETDNVQVKSSGIMGAGIVALIGFGAFVEVDDFQMYNRDVSWKTRVRTYTGGIWSNVIIGGIFLGLLLLTPQLTQIGYGNTTFQVQSVLSGAEGGYNEGNIEVGDIAYSINGTRLDYAKGISLDAFLANETDVKFSAGDDMLITCIDISTNEYYDRVITLGHRVYVGFTYANISNSVFQVDTVFNYQEGGNNVGNIPEGVEIVAVNNQSLNYSTGITFDWIMTQQVPPYQLNLTASNNTIYQINVDYYPRASGSYILNDAFLGILFEETSDSTVTITEVLLNETEYGINEGAMPEDTVITHVNGIAIDISEISFPNWLLATIDPEVGDQLIFTAQDGTDYTLDVGKIPVIPVYIGILNVEYSLPDNWLGKLFGGEFPAKFESFVSLTFAVALSLALFNLLPTAIFDGGRMTKEILDKIVGIDEKFDEHTKLHYRYNPEEHEQHLMTHNITKIIGFHRMDLIEKETPIEKPPKGKINPEDYQLTPIEFETIDEYGNGYIEKIKPAENVEILPETLMEVEVEHIIDRKAPLKNKIYRAISWTVGGIVLASFIISIVKFNSTLFWL